MFPFANINQEHFFKGLPEDVPFDRRSSIFELDCSGNRLESLSETIGELETCVH